MSTRLAALTLSLCAVIGVTACGGDDSSTDTTASPSTDAPATATDAPAGDGTASEASIVIANFAFTVTPGAPGEITVTNDDTAKHTATADDGTFNVELDPGASSTITVDAAGTYAFHCTIHTSMKSELVVE